MIKYRYIINNDLFIPEYSKDEGTTWLRFTQPKVEGEMLRIANALAGKDNYDRQKQLFFSNSPNDMFFIKESHVNAFLAATKTIQRQIIVNFDENNQEP